MQLLFMEFSAALRWKQEWKKRSVKGCWECPLALCHQKHLCAGHYPWDRVSSAGVATPAIPSFDVLVCSVVTNVLSQTSFPLFFSYIILGKQLWQIIFSLLLSLHMELILGERGVFLGLDILLCLLFLEQEWRPCMSQLCSGVGLPASRRCCARGAAGWSSLQMSPVYLLPFQLTARTAYRHLQPWFHKIHYSTA